MNNNKISLKEIIRNQGGRNVTFTLLAILVFISIILIYNIMLLNSINEGVVRRGQVSAERSGQEFNEFISDCTNSVSITEFTLNKLIIDGRSEEDILSFIKQQNASLVNTIGQQTTKLFACIDGMIYDGQQGVIRKPDYVIEERPWYRKAMSGNNDFVLVDPYNDVHTGQMLMTISKTMSDGKSIIGLDVSMEYIQTAVERETASNKNLTGMVLDSRGYVVAHTDVNEIGKNYFNVEPDSAGAVVAQHLNNTDEYFEFTLGGHGYTAYIVPIHGGWHSVSVLATVEEYMPIRIMFLITVTLSVLILVSLVIIVIRSGRQGVMASRMNSQLSSAANIYLSLSDINLENMTLTQIKDIDPGFVSSISPDVNDVQLTFNKLMESLPDNPTKQAAKEFVDLSTLNDRLSGKDSISLEYMSFDEKWVRGRFLASGRAPDGKLTNVLWMLEDITAEKHERDDLTKQTEKLTSQLSSAADIYISLCDLDIPNNSAVAIKNANPAIAKAVEAGKDNMQATFFGIMRGLPETPTKQAAIDFCDLSKINEKLKDTNTMTVEYISYGNIWVRGRYVVSERDSSGNVTHVLWMLENIDAEKRARDDLTEQAQKLTSQLSSAADIYISLCELDIPHNSAVAIKNANPAIAKAVEAGKDGRMQETFFGIMRGLPESPTKQAAIDFCDLSKVNDKLKDVNTITVEYLSYGNIWVRGRYVVSVRDDDGNVTHVLWMLENIDAEKRARDRLSAYAEKLNNQMRSIASIYMSAYDFDLANDTFSEVRATNSEVIDLVGDNRENAQETLYLVMDKLCDESAAAAVREFMDLSTLDERLSDTRTITIEYLSNEKTWRRARFIESERAPDGKLRHVLLVAEDIDKEKKAREELIDISERAIAASEAKSSFLSNMSHEIRTPINAVLGMNEMVLRESTEPNIITYSESIRTAGTTLLGLINDILDFSKIEAGKMEIIPVDYDLATMLNDLVNMIETRAEAKGLVVIPEFDSNIPEHLHGDEVRIKQVITNILTNAVKYTEKGSVTLGVTYSTIKNDPDSIMMKVSVKDTGIGIKKEDMSKLFSQFERIEEERNRTVEGTGLGMSITQSLLAMMGSSLKVESVYGEGSVFSFELKQQVRKWDPLGDYKTAFRNAVSTREKYQEKFTAPDARVLVVDDTKMNLVVFTSLIKTTDVKIDTAESGDEGIVLALKNKYDIIFLDHMMPNKDGIETLKEIKAQVNGPNKDTPMICLTANAISGAREKYLEAGFDDYLTKPIESVRLEEMMYEYLPTEKIKTVKTVQKAAPEPQEPKPVIPDFVFYITELDAIEGIKNAGSEEMYIQLLKSYSSMMDSYLEATEKYWLSGDMANASIKLHSLKSASRTIGAHWIGRTALQLEHAAQNNDTQTVTAGITELMYRCRALAAQLSQLN